MKYNNSLKTIITPLLVSLGIVLGIIVGIRLDKLNFHNRMLRNINSNTRFSNDKINQVWSLVKTQYVDDVNMDSIAEKVIPEILKNLDPHSVYIPASELVSVNDELRGNFEGIGVTINMPDDTVIIFNVLSGGPSYRAGVQNGDRIITIDDSIVAGKNLGQNDIVRMLRGERGSTVDIEVKRNGYKELISITVTRDIILLKSLDAAIMLTDEIGYIKLMKFSSSTHRELLQAIEALEKQGMQKLIFDLRDNSGGYMEQAILISNEFLPANSLIVYTIGKGGRREEKYSNGKGRLTDIPLVVLINETSASSSEIVAGAIQDHDRGTIIGRRSFGKGLVQEQIAFPDGSAMRLTISRYYTPIGRSIQKPYDKGVEAYNNELRERFLHNELFTADSINFPDSLKFVTPEGKTVYGGGGIMPDIFIPADTTKLDSFTRELFVRSILHKFSSEYADRHRAELNKIESIDEMDLFFRQHPQIFNELIQYAKNNGITPSPRDIESSRNILSNNLKAYISRNTALEDNGFYYYIQDLDNAISESKIFFEENVPLN